MIYTCTLGSDPGWLKAQGLFPPLIPVGGSNAATDRVESVVVQVADWLELRVPEATRHCLAG